ncbi:signal transducer [Pseudohyphozyma bogoriensis]|nr:signal transducer [Pseudohyphozyma bogoriensis]
MLGLEETGDSVVVSFGASLWHVDCRCAKCHNLVEHDTNLLLLSDGSPVCENCSYICSVCQKPISNEAIVTGDESYHADCFRCRSCSNKIEELIFAKTSQGIWCMACHNERVARSRKHAEAKRNRSSRKDKEGKSPRPRERDRDREREKSGLSSTPITAGSDATFDLTELSNAMGGIDGALGASGSGSAASTPAARPLPPSPYASSSHVPTQTFPGVPVNRPKTSPSTGRSRLPSETSTQGGDFPGSMSAQSLSSIATRGSSTTSPSIDHTPLHSRQTSAVGGLQTNDMERSISHMSDVAHDVDAAVISNVPLPKRATSPVVGTDRAVSPVLPSTSPSRDPNASPHPELASSPTFPSSRQGSLSSLPTAPSSRQGSLSAPPGVDKTNNRRSGFYGAFQRPTVDPDAPEQLADRDGAISPPPRDSRVSSLAEAAAPGRSTPSPAPSFNSTSAATSGATPSFLPELHNSMSFYDPDTLLFLDHVGSEPGSPKHPKMLKESQRSYSNGMVDLSATADQVEHLSPDIGAPKEGGEEEEEEEETSRERNPKSEVARKVRESIRRSREGTKGGAMSMDVDLVEMLLAELDSTKKGMQDLQSKYNAFRRASRSAFEGFSMAREEYDKEVAMRHEVESQMEELRLRFTEQALKLAAVDREQRNAEAIKRKSKELRSSVVGMEKHLSQLRAQVELSTAHFEELGQVDKDGFDVPSRSQAANVADMERSLNARLEAVKERHRVEIEELVKQRDELIREVEELRQTRDVFIEETATLNQQNSTLADQNAEATRLLEITRDTHTRLRSPELGVEHRLGHNHTASSTSLPLVPGRSPLQGSRSGVSPTPPPDYEIDHQHRIARPENIEPHAPVVKKFKWGKASKTETPRSNASHAPSPSTTKALPPARVNGGSTDLSKAHTFGQTSILRPVRCEYCGDKMWGLNEVRCGACGCYAHAKCAGYLQNSCGQPSVHSQDDTMTIPSGVAMFGNDLSTQARSEDRQVPIVVSKCIGAVEAYGMNYEGVYRKTGGMGQTKLITQCFERGQDFNLEDLDKFNDLAAITSCMKNFFRALPDPLFTHDLHETFVACAEMPDGDARLNSIEQAIYQLPEAHFYTARMLLGHLHRVHLRSGENKMTPANLGVVFGPTVLRSRHASREFSDMGFKAKLVEIMVEQHPRLFAKPYTSPSED